MIPGRPALTAHGSSVAPRPWQQIFVKVGKKEHSFGAADRCRRRGNCGGERNFLGRCTVSASNRRSRQVLVVPTWGHPHTPDASYSPLSRSTQEFFSLPQCGSRRPFSSVTSDSFTASSSSQLRWSSVGTNQLREVAIVGERECRLQRAGWF
jgi:hypothetical protein